MEVKLRAEKILSKQFPDIYWFTKIEHLLKRSIVSLLRYSTQFVPGFSVINSQIPTNRKNSPK